MAPASKKQRLSDGSAVAVQKVDSEAAPAEAGKSPAKAAKAANPESAKRSLFVRQLPASTTTESLTELFSNSYPVKHATAILDPATKECRGYGFVTFADAEDALRAKEEFHGHVIDGKKLRVELAEPRQRDGDKAKEEKAVKEKELPQASKLIVRNLPWSIKGSEQLTKLFRSYGKVKQAYIPKKGPGLMAGFGFVIMRGRKNAEKAIEGVNGKVVDGRTLAVDWSVEKSAYENANAEQGDGPGKEHVVRDEDDEDDLKEEDLIEDGSDVVDDSEEDVGDSEDEDGVAVGDEDDVEGEDADEDDEEDEEDEPRNRTEDKTLTIFVRNLPFTCTDEDLEDHFAQFGSTRYARVVMDPVTERSRGTGFVCFYDKEAAESCLRNAPRRQIMGIEEKKKDKNAHVTQSILQNNDNDPSGQYTLDGRVLQVSAAVERGEANRLAEEGTVQRTKRDNDKRRLYLLREGTIPSNSKLWAQLPPSEQAMRESSVKQRKTLIESNPSLNLSLTRLSIRNIPRSIGSKELKALARDAIVGFASDVKNGEREKLSKEELSRSSEEMQAAEAARKRSGKGVVKQATVVFEGASGTKVGEESGAGRSRGYGFIEYHTHRNALMGLRWLNGHAVGYQVKEGATKVSREEIQDRKKRLIVEFAIENAQVVGRRKELEEKARTRSRLVKDQREDGKRAGEHTGSTGRGKPQKRKRASDVRSSINGTTVDAAGDGKNGKPSVDEKTAQRNRIIGRKRAVRRARAGGK